MLHTIVKSKHKTIISQGNNPKILPKNWHFNITKQHTESSQNKPTANCWQNHWEVGNKRNSPNKTIQVQIIIQQQPCHLLLVYLMRYNRDTTFSSEASETEQWRQRYSSFILQPTHDIMPPYNLSISKPWCSSPHPTPKKQPDSSPPTVMRRLCLKIRDCEAAGSTRGQFHCAQQEKMFEKIELGKVLEEGL